MSARNFAFLEPIKTIAFFQYGTIAPDDATIATRDVAIDPITDFTTTTPHGLTSGQGMSARFTGTIPVPLNDGQTYYVGVIDAFTVQLFSDSLNAEALQYPIALSSIIGYETLQMELRDQRNSQVVTSLKFASAPTFAIDSPNEVVFPTLPLPAPLEQKKTYFAQPIDSLNLNIFSSLSDAKSNSNPIYTTGSILPIDIDIRKPIVPETKLVFSVRHYFNDGDQVKAITNGGTLPQPLIENQNYFVNVIDNFSVSLHENQADAVASTDTNFVNPIKITTEGAGTNSLVKLIQATAKSGKENQITAIGLNISAPSGADASCSLITVGSVTSARIVSQGSEYVSDPDVTFSAPNANDLVDGPLEGKAKTATGYAIRDTINNKVINVVITDPGFGYSSAPTITISEPSQQIFTITNLTTISGTTVQATVSENPSYANNNKIKISGSTVEAYNGTFTITNVSTVSPWTFRYNCGVAGQPIDTSDNITSQKIAGSQATATATITTSFVSKGVVNNGGSGYTESPQVQIKGGSGSGATATANVSAGVVTNVNIITSGSGYSIAPDAIITPSTGVYVNFSSTGTLPSPLTSGTSYLAESPDVINKTFTVKNTDFSDVNITSAGTGTFYVVLSRSFGVDFTNNWLGDFTTLATGQQIYFGTDYILPTTSPSIDNSVTPFYLSVASNTLAKVYADSGLTTIINIDSFGTGQTYYAIRTQVSPSVDSNLIKPVNTAYLTENETVQFSSSGTLPTPLVGLTDYKIKIIGDAIRIYSGLSPVVLTSTGIGQLSLDIIRDVQVQPSNNIVADSSLYETGTVLVTRAKEGDTLPTGLLPNTNYYVRRIDNNSFELYDTLANARDLTSTTGRRVYTTTGNSVSSTFFVDAISDPIFVKSVAHIEKPITDGYVSLYAWDYGRSNDMTLIGQYHPTEINPSYRRIRIGKPCAWARIIYKVTNPSISSVYDYIQLEQERAIIAAVHAVDLEDKDFADQAMRYWQIAFGYLKNQQESIDGHAMAVPQINSVCYAEGDGADPVMW